ncbi:c-type cytochrome domain-containing protein [Fuerstiella marisgermanici]|uniref:Planctomycete cytochrome C n=1 Tax=Fuerstiella marisgermanici TaxID=1891926 RepID=A0A1P8W9X8_9PLAN|nr:c-type cytochrome domain-containing protein [Fuerstiella marisgermanici]APZ90864.1 Planctomycete cytochrome C [Fuerstiella marisgermanici]
MRILLALLISCFACSTADAALPPEVRRQLTDLNRELRPVLGMLRQNKVDEAQAIIQKVETELAGLNIAEDEKDRSLSLLQSSIARAKAAIPVSFEQEVAPILKANCLGCHGNNQPRADLNMTTFANMKRGSKSGVLLLPRNPNRSLIMARIMTDNDQARMPKGAAKLSDDDISTIGRWIAGGAIFDGADENAAIGEAAKPKKPPIKVVMADGSETVSFKNDIAPWIVNVCSGCHTGRRVRGGYNLATFESLLEGGDTGSTIVPGAPDGSYIVDLVLRQDPLKMPAGNQVTIKRSQAKALEKWIKEGAHFDGTDPKAPIRSLVPTAAELEAAMLAAMSDSEFADRRKEQAETNWKRVAPREEATASTTDDLYVYGNVPQSRLDELASWGQEQVSALTEKYKLPAGEKPWRGRLIVFATKDRFDYEEFNTVLLNRSTPRGVSGHAVVSENFADAYVAMHDVGNADSADALNARQQLNSLLAQAFLGRSGADLPDWLSHGFGILESGATPTSPFMQALPKKAADAVSTLNSPASLFDNGTFGPSDAGSVGYLLTKFLVSRSGMAKLGQFVTALKASGNAARAIQTAYGQSAADLGRAFLQSSGR